MKYLIAVAMLTVTGLLGFAGNHSVNAQNLTDIKLTSYEMLSVGSYPTKTVTASDTVSYDTSSNELNIISSDTSSLGIYPVKTVGATYTLSYDASYGDIKVVSSDTSSLGIYPTNNLTSSSTTIYPTNSQPVIIQGDSSTPATNSNLQPTYHYGSPQLSSSSPAGGGAISGSNYKFTATISDPNNQVHNVRFMLYDANRNLLLDSDSTLNEAGEWVANTPFDSTAYADGSGYVLEITSEGDPGTSDIRYTLSWNSVYFGIDNVKSNEVSTYPDINGNTIINNDFVATAYHNYPYQEIPVISVKVQFYFVDGQGNNIPQGNEQNMTKDLNTYSGLWGTESLDSRNFFTNGNGRYVAVFNSTYQDGATTSKEALFEVYISDDTTAPDKPVIVNPVSGAILAPGSITYKWSGNEDDDIVGLNFERGEIDPNTGAYEGRAGGYSDIRDGSSSWTTESITPTEATTINWRIQVRDRAGNWSEWSNVSSYTVDPNYVPDTTPPPKPTTLSPINNLNVNNSKVIQSWVSDTSDIDYYFYESYKDPQRKNLIVQEKVSTNTRTTINHNNGAIWWRVQAVDKSGNKSEWSDLLKMTVSNKR